MSKEYRIMKSDEFTKYIDCICNRLQEFININNIKIDYICPILRSGAIPAVYISNRLNIVKFAPAQVKHVAYKNGENKIEMLFNPFDSIDIKKKEPSFLVVDCMLSTGTSAGILIKEIKRRYIDAKILYVCIAKQYGSKNFKDDTIYEDVGFYCNCENNYSKEKCKELNIEYDYPIFPWEDLESEISHPDDLEKNIFF